MSIFGVPFPKLRFAKDGPSVDGGCRKQFTGFDLLHELMKVGEHNLGSLLVGAAPDIMEMGSRGATKECSYYPNSY
ncbi:hypothetical protein J2TS4_47900 [Paenibacillus sp. J2TS4]|nr:hypothetical protein J2TS4_47900 [Paenibacillus sp. J2TS4]